MIIKRGKQKGHKVYYMRFVFNGKTVFRSTKTTDKRAAKDIEAAVRAELAKGNFGILEPKEPAPEVPTLAQFARESLTWAESAFRDKAKTWLWYRNGIRRILECTEITTVKLDKLTVEHLDKYVAYRHSCEIGPKKKRLQTSSINRELQVLRHMLNRAVAYGKIAVAPKVTLLDGEREREFVLTPEEEAKYLFAAPEPLASVATVLVDTGLRPEEAYRLRWEFVTWINGRHGSVMNTHGKTKAARRTIPMTTRVRAILEARWNAAGKPVEGWVWPAPTKSGHIEPSTLKKQHRNVIHNCTVCHRPTGKCDQKKFAHEFTASGIRPFVLYSLRHTCLTRWGMSGMNVWILAALAGHSDIKISARYVHPSDDHMLNGAEGVKPPKPETDGIKISSNADQKQLSA
jgi:integrase